MLKQYTNFGGETFGLPAMLTVYFKNSKVSIQGIDSKDCYEILMSRYDEFGSLNHNIDMNTLKLNEYYKSKCNL